MKTRNEPFTAGEFRFLVEVQKVHLSNDGAGGQTKSWKKHAEFFAAVTNQSGTERYSDSALGRVRTQQKWLFTTWYREDITVEMRLFFNGQHYNIRVINNLELRNKFIQIEAESGVEQ